MISQNSTNDRLEILLFDEQVFTDLKMNHIPQVINSVNPHERWEWISASIPLSEWYKEEYLYLKASWTGLIMSSLTSASTAGTLKSYLLGFEISYQVLTDNVFSECAVTWRTYFFHLHLSKCCYLNHAHKSESIFTSSCGLNSQRNFGTEADGQG